MVKNHPHLHLKCGTVANGGYGATIMCRKDSIRRSRDHCAGCAERREK